MDFMKSVKKKIFKKGKKDKLHQTAFAGFPSPAFTFEAAGFFISPRKRSRWTWPVRTDCLSLSCWSFCRSACRSTAAMWRRLKVLVCLMLEYIKEAENAQKEFHNKERDQEGLKRSNEGAKGDEKGGEGEKLKIAKLEAELEELRRNKEEVEGLRERVESDRRMMAELNESLRNRERIIKEYDEKFDLMEEQTQSAIGENSVSKYKASTLDFHVVTLQQKIDELQKLNEEISLTKEREINSIMQERIENKKVVGSLERRIAVLSKEKSELEKRLTADLPKVRRMAKKAVSAEVQTDVRPVTRTGEEAKERLAQREEDLARMEKCVASLKCELDKVTLRSIHANKDIERLRELLDARESELDTARQRAETLGRENAELRKKKERALGEIRDLRRKLEKRRVAGSAEASPAGPLKNAKDARYASEAVVCVDVSVDFEDGEWQ